MIRFMLALILSATSLPTVVSAQDAARLQAYLSMEMPASGYSAIEDSYIGFEIDMIAELLKDAPIGIEVDFKDAPNWKRAIESVRHGEADFLTLVSYRDERLSFMDYIGPFNTETAYLITREAEELGALRQLDDLALGDQYILIDEAISWDSEFDKKLAEDADYRSNFIIRKASDNNRILDLERLATDHEYRAEMETEDTLIYEDGEAALLSVAQRISYGRLGGTILIADQAVDAINANAERIAEGGPGVALKATRIEAFGTPVTFLVSSRNTPVEIRNHMKKRYVEVRRNGVFNRLWKRWYGDIEPPEFIKPEYATK